MTLRQGDERGSPPADSRNQDNDPRNAQTDRELGASALASGAGTQPSAPVGHQIPYGWHQITEADISAVCRVLRHQQLTQGDEVDQFEREVAAYCQAPDAVACNSGSSALLLACRALGLGPGDRLWTSALTFVASASCALHCGADVDLIDIDPTTGNLSLPALRTRLEQAARTDQLPKILIAVHFAGRLCDMPAIASLARDYGFMIIEDAAHALGAQCPDDATRPVGHCHLSKAAVFSFHPVKLITSGEGGMITTRDPALATRARQLRSHAIQRADQKEGPDWRYRIQEPGYNFRLTDIQAALGRSQLARIDGLLARRRVLAQRYRRLLAQTPLQLPPQDPLSAWHLYCVQCPSAASRKRLFLRFKRAGIGVQVHYQPLYRLALFADSRRFSVTDFPGAEHFYARALSLPLFPDLTEAAQDQVVQLIETELGERGSD